MESRGRKGSNFKMMTETKKECAVALNTGRAERRSNFDYLKQIKIRTLVIAGEQDFFFKLEDVKKMAFEISGAEFKLIQHSGHLPNMEKPEEFNETISLFYEKIYH